MKSFIIGFALLKLASLSYAAPGSARMEVRQAPENVITFQGAGPNPPSYTLTIPDDGSTFPIHNSLSVSHIISASGNPGTCTFFGVDGSVTTVPAGGNVEVGPPQALVSGTCSPPSSAPKPRQTAQIEADVLFIGAGPNPPTFEQVFIANGTRQAISNTLSVSHISITSDGVSCTFYGIDGSVTVVQSGQTVDVGPPQQEVSAVCYVVG